MFPLYNNDALYGSAVLVDAMTVLSGNVRWLSMCNNIFKLEKDI